MKNIGLLVLAVSALMLFGCYSKVDDGFGRSVRLSISDAVVFDNQENYVVGDTLFFELSFSRYLEEEGFPELLDVFETSKTESFTYRFDLKEFSEFSGYSGRVFIDSEFILTGRPDTAGNDEFNYTPGEVAAILNPERTTYTSRVGIVLVETGQFSIDFQFFRLFSAFDFNEVNVEIVHELTDENPLNTEFTVSEN